jgi:hypothetical protein
MVDRVAAVGARVLLQHHARPVQRAQQQPVGLHAIAFGGLDFPSRHCCQSAAEARVATSTTVSMAASSAHRRGASKLARSQAGNPERAARSDGVVPRGSAKRLRGDFMIVSSSAAG